jgi:hypothetical protein
MMREKRIQNGRTKPKPKIKKLRKHFGQVTFIHWRPRLTKDPMTIGLNGTFNSILRYVFIMACCLTLCDAIFHQILCRRVQNYHKESLLHGLRVDLQPRFDHSSPRSQWRILATAMDGNREPGDL